MLGSRKKFFAHPYRMRPTLRDLAAPLFRRQRVLLLTVIFVSPAAVLLGFLKLQRYESHMTIRLDRDLDREPLALAFPLVKLGATSQQGSHATGDREALNDPEIIARQEQLVGRELLAEVAQASDVPKNGGKRLLGRFSPQELAGEGLLRALGRFTTQIEMNAALTSNRIEVTCRSSDPVEAYAVLDRLAHIYLQKRDAVGGQVERSSLDSGPPFPQKSESSQSYQAALEDAEAGLRTVARTARASSAPREGRVASDQSQMIKMESWPLNEADLEREAKDEERQYLRFLSEREQERSAEERYRTRMENVAIAVPPSISGVPTHGPLFILSVAFGLTMLVGLSAAYATDCFDPSFHTSAQVSEMLGIPIVVAVPRGPA